MKSKIIIVIACLLTVIVIVATLPKKTTETPKVIHTVGAQKFPQYHGVRVTNCFAHDDCYK